MTGEVYVWIIIELPEPMGAIIIDAKADRANVPAGILVSRLESAIEGDAVASVQFAPPDHMSVLLSRVQTHVKDRESLNPIVTAELMTDAKLNRITGVPEQIEERFQVRSGISGKGRRLSRTQLEGQRG